MKTIDVLHLPNSLWLGRKGEQNFRPIAFEWGAWKAEYPNAILSVIYTAPNSNTPLVVATGTNSPVIWQPTTDVSTVSGFGAVECHLLDGDNVVGISAEVTTIIDDSASSANQTPPSWVDQVVREVAEAAGHYPKIENGNWLVWDSENEEWSNTGVRAYGIDGHDGSDGADGHSPYIGTNGHWFVYDDVHETWSDTGVSASVDETVIANAVAAYLDEHPITETDPTVPTWAKQPTKPTYTASEVGALPADTPIPAAVTIDSELSATSTNPVQNKVITAALPSYKFDPNDAIYEINNSKIAAKYDAYGDEIAETYAPKSQLNAKYTKPSGGIPKTDLASDVQTSLGKADTALQTAPVTSVNTKTGAVTLSASDVGALPSSTTIPTKTSDLTNDSGFVDAAQAVASAPIQTVKVNGTALVPDANKAVDVPVPTVADVLSEAVMIVYLTPTSADLSGTMSKTGSEILAAHEAGIRIVASVVGLDGAFEWNQTVNGSMVTQFLYSSGGDRELIQVVSGTGSSTSYYAHHIAQLPAVTASDNGKFLRVVSGAWAAETVQTWQGGSY